MAPLSDDQQRHILATGRCIGEGFDDHRLNTLFLTMIQLVQVFSAAVVAGATEIEASKRLIEFLASARASETIRNSRMEAPAK